MSQEGEDRSVLPFLLPQSAILCGSTQCGKTTYLRKLLLDSSYMFQPKPEKVVYCYAAWQSSYQELEEHWGDNIEFRTSVPSREELLEISQNFQHVILVLDDLMHQLCNDDIVSAICFMCSHRNLSTFLLIQNFYYESKHLRTISLNVQSILLFRNYRSVRQVKTLASQMCPGNTEYFMSAYEKATSKPYSCLIIDINPRSDRKFHLRSGVLRDELPIVYLPIKK